MGKTDGSKTKEHILKAAESLFSAEGYDGTSVARIAKQAGVNKGAIYYHFKNKEDILNELFKSLTKQVLEVINKSIDSIHDANHSNNIFNNKMEDMLRFIEKRKNIINIMFMESLKESDKDFSLFKCADILMNDEIKGILIKTKKENKNKNVDKQELQVYEFFTGFIPIITFAIFRQRWSNFFNYSSEKLNASFLKAFKNTHLAAHFIDELKKE